MSFILPPIRCHECGKVLGHLWELWWKMTTIDPENGYQKKDPKIKPQKVLDQLGITKFCCRNIMLNSISYQ